MRLLTIAVISVATLPSSAVHAQATPSTFVITAGADTVAVEQFTHDAGSVVGDLRLPSQQQHVHYTAYLKADGSPARADVINDTRNFFTGTIAFDANSGAAARGNADRLFRAPGAYPVIGISVALMEQLIRSVHPLMGDSARVRVVNIRNRMAAMATIRRVSPDSVVVACDGCMRLGAVEELHFAVARNGDITGGVSSSPDWKITRR
jgi:hypothetical protein